MLSYGVQRNMEYDTLLCSFKQNKNKDLLNGNNIQYRPSNTQGIQNAVYEGEQEYVGDFDRTYEAIHRKR